MKYIIMAAGMGTRWNNYLGVPKHLIELNGETLLGRTTIDYYEKMELQTMLLHVKIHAMRSMDQLPRKQNMIAR